MISFCLKCRRNIQSKNPRAAKAKNENQCFYQNVQCMIVKNHDLSKNKKLVGN